MKRQSAHRAHHVDIRATNWYDPSVQIVQQSRFRSEYHELCYEVLFVLGSERYNGRIGVIRSTFLHIYKHDSCF